MKYLLFNLLILLNTFLNITCHFCVLLNSTNVNDVWKQYKTKYDKNYTGILDKRRKAIWLHNCEKILKHNQETKQGKYNFTLSANTLSDMTIRRYQTTMTRLLKSRWRDLDPESVGSTHLDYSNIPEELDWRQKGFISRPYNQKDCGSCYAFSIAHVIQAQIYKQTNITEALSEQQIIDCSLNLGNHGCGGGSLRNTLKYLDRVGGLMKETDYPYVARQSLCKFDKSKIIVNVTSWAILPPRDESKMQAIIANVGPIAASINASPHTFQLYKSGVYDDISCSENVVNHAMLIVGYTKDAWILKNWWGSKWGEDGYMRLKRNRNQCGISNYVAYVNV